MPDYFLVNAQGQPIPIASGETIDELEDRPINSSTESQEEKTAPAQSKPEATQ